MAAFIVRLLQNKNIQKSEICSKHEKLHNTPEGEVIRPCVLQDCDRFSGRASYTAIRRTSYKMK